MRKPPETIKNFLPNDVFPRFALESMKFPYFSPCDYTSQESEADGSIWTFGQDLRTVGIKKHEVMFQAVLFNRAIASCLSSDFYAKQSYCIGMLADLLNVKKWWMLRVNCTVGQDKNYVGRFHCDFDLDIPYIHENATTAILYLNTNNGGTQFYDEDGPIVKSEANTLIKFPTSTRHAGVWATDAKLRYVLNMTYETK